MNSHASLARNGEEKVRGWVLARRNSYTTLHVRNVGVGPRRHSSSLCQQTSRCSERLLTA